ncbi:MAG: secretion system protein [Acidimicrobiales bacterium mtb01]|nr:MAG: secretion system protein [Acidimicrobiales bacterium mtb01]
MNALLGSMAGVGALLVLSALRGPRLSLALDRYSPGFVDQAATRPLVTALASVFPPAHADLMVTGTTPERQVFERLVCGTSLAVLPVVSGVVMSMGGVSLPPIGVVVFVIGGAALGLWLPSLTLAKKARRLRREMRSSLSGYLDLVAIMLAGGAGIETALSAAARVGGGPTFDVVTDALRVAHSTRRSPWDLLAERGRELGLRELPELAASVKLGGEQGARMTASLVAKAASLRASHMADIEASANSSTERMGLPMVLMFVSFLVLLGYPAMHLISRGF